MTIDYVGVVEILFLARILWQGELIVKYERGVYEIHTNKERKQSAWREAKRSAVLKKIEFEAALAKEKALAEEGQDGSI